jgi:NitT/TauT family transport system ATP-binding protein
VFITHSISEALAVGERIVVLRRPARIAYDVRLDAGSGEHDAIRKRIQDVLAE